MRGGQTPLVAPSIRRLAGACLLLSAALSGTSAARQVGPSNPAPPPGMANPKRAAIERQEREAILRNTGLTPRRVEDMRGTQAAAEQVKQDFKRIQILRNNLVRHLAADGPLDYKVIAGESAEVNKRASRLRTYLVPQSQDGRDERPRSQIELEGELLRSALITLCQRIDSFTGSPVFKVLGVVDVEKSAAAGRDLQGIIRLSARIKEGAERMNKTVKR